ncbi:MAG: hypothetical protein ACOCSL_01315 [Thermoplasmatota archaeon]
MMDNRLTLLAIKDWTINLSDLTDNLYFFGYSMLLGIRKILLAIMFLSTFICTVKEGGVKRIQTIRENASEEWLK